MIDTPSRISPVVRGVVIWCGLRGGFFFFFQFQILMNGGHSVLIEQLDNPIWSYMVFAIFYIKDQNGKFMHYGVVVINSSAQQDCINVDDS